MRKAKAHYYAETDSLFIDVADRPANRTVEVAANILVAYDEDGQVVAIEFPGGARDLFQGLIDQEVQARLAKQKAS